MSRELDAEVAEKVMGWKFEKDWAEWESLDAWAAFPDEIKGKWSIACSDWNPSTSITDAWLVVEKMREKYGFEGNNGFLVTMEPEIKDGVWYCEFPKPKWECAKADTAPEAICRAALKAVEGR